MILQPSNFMILSFLSFLHLKWTRSDPSHYCVQELPDADRFRHSLIILYLKEQRGWCTECWKQNIWLLFSGPVPKPSLIFKILGLLHFLNPQTLTFFQSFCLMSFPSSALSLLLLLPQFSPSWTWIPKFIFHFSTYQKRTCFSLHISHFYNQCLDSAYI